MLWALGDEGVRAEVRAAHDAAVAAGAPTSWASSPTATIRLVASVLAEQNDEWAVVRRYMSSESLTKARLHIIDGGRAESVTQHTLAEVG